jgi:uncharacterized protein YodC (DUF2158 family)
MLIENNQPNKFSIGDLVRVKSTGLTGKITGFVNGKWIVQVQNAAPLHEDAGNLAPTQVLLG